MSDEVDQPMDLGERTKRFALRIIRLFCALPKATLAQVLGNQLLRAGTSVGAHYREAVRGRSNAEFISKLQVGLQELEETAYWLELLAESRVFRETRLSALNNETNELIAIFTTCVKKVKGKK